LACSSTNQKFIENTPKSIHTKERVAVQNSSVFGFKNMQGLFYGFKSFKLSSRITENEREAMKL
jgi:hypothetical protein